MHPLRRLIALGSLLGAIALPASAVTYTIVDGTTQLWLDPDAIADAGLTGPYVGGSDVVHVGPINLNVSSSTLAFSTPDYAASGELNHSGEVSFRDGSDGLHTIGNLSIRYDESRSNGGLLSGLYIEDLLGGYGVLFDIGNFSDPWISGSMIAVGPAMLVVAPELAALLGDNFLGREVGTISFEGTVRETASVPEEASLLVTAMMAGLLVAAGRFRRRHGLAA